MGEGAETGGDLRVGEVDIGSGDEKVRQWDDVGAAGVSRPGGAVSADAGR